MKILFHFPPALHSIQKMAQLSFKWRFLEKQYVKQKIMKTHCIQVYIKKNILTHSPLNHRVRTKHGPGVHGPPLWTGSMDHFHGPGPWTPCHGPGPWTVFFIFIRRFCTRSMDNQKQKYSQNRFDGTLSTNAHD